MKQCPKCEAMKPAGDFYRDRTKSTGLSSYCRECAKAACRASYVADRENRKRYSKAYNLANAERIREWRRANREANRDALNERNRAWATDNPEAKKRSARRSYLKHRERRIADAKAWGQANRDRRNASWRMTDLKRRAGRPLDDDGRTYIGILLRDPCSYCDGLAGTIDHIVALAKGGSNDWDCLTAACHRCNASKQTRSLLDYLMARQALAGDVAVRLEACRLPSSKPRAVKVSRA